MKCCPRVSETMLASGQLPEIAGSPWYDVVKELKRDSPLGPRINRNVKLHMPASKNEDW